MNVCSRACGYCGACDDGLRNRREPVTVRQCVRCGGDIIPGITGNITVAGVGAFCSRACVEATHEQRKSA